MKNKNNGNNSGFHLIIIPLIVVIIGIIGFAGWYVWDTNEKNNSATNSQATTPTPTSSVSVTPTVSTTKYLEISEWGIKVPLSSAIQEAIYTPYTSLVNDELQIFLSTQNINSLYPECAGVSPSMVEGVARYFRFANTDANVNELLQAHPNSPKIGNYYYYYLGHIKPCAEGFEAGTAQFEQSAPLREAFQQALLSAENI